MRCQRTSNWPAEVGVDLAKSSSAKSPYPLSGHWGLENENSTRGAMTKGRLEAFSDGVIAVIITLMVLEMKVPHGVEPPALLPVVPVFLTYRPTFGFIGGYWNNHHQLFHAVRHLSRPLRQAT